MFSEMIILADVPDRHVQSVWADHMTGEWGYLPSVSSWWKATRIVWFFSLFKKLKKKIFISHFPSKTMFDSAPEAEEETAGHIQVTSRLCGWSPASGGRGNLCGRISSFSDRLHGLPSLISSSIAIHSKNYFIATSSAFYSN